MDRPAAEHVGRRGEQAGAGKPEAEGEPYSQGRARAHAGPRHDQQREPQGLHGDEQGHEPRVEILSRPHHGAGAAEEQHDADPGGGADLRPGRGGVAAPQAPADQDGAGDEESQTDHAEAGKGVHQQTDGQIGRAPNDINGGKSRDDFQAARRETVVVRDGSSFTRHPVLLWPRIARVSDLL